MEQDLVDKVNFVIDTKIKEFRQEDPKYELTEIIDFLHDHPGGPYCD